MNASEYKTVVEGVPPFFAAKYAREASRNWDRFYRRNRANFFKDRHWTTDARSDGFSSLRDAAEAAALSNSTVAVVEAGCGAANCAFPLLEEHPALFVHMFDFAPSAVALVRSSPQYDTGRSSAFVWDFAANPLPADAAPLRAGTAHFALLVFVLSAVPPDRQQAAVCALARLLRPGGRVLFRDYATGDMAQARFARSSTIAHNYFVRQDGTLSYFFDEERIHELMCAAGLRRLYCRRVHRKNINRKRQLEMNRVFLQAEYELPDETVLEGSEENVGVARAEEDTEAR